MRLPESSLRSSIWVLAVGVLTLGYGLYSRQLMSSGARTTNQARFWDVVVETLGNPQFIIFVLLGSWLLHAVLSGSEDVAPQRLLRLGTFKRVLTGGVARASWQLAGMGVVVVLSTFLAASGLPLASPASSELGPQTVSGVFASIAVPASIASIWQFIQLGIVFLVIRSCFAALRISVQKPALEVALAIGVWLWAASSTVGLFEKGSPLNAGLYFQASAAVEQPAAYARAIVTLGLIGAVATLFVVAADARRTKSWRLHLSPAVIQALAVLLVLSVTIGLSQPRELSLFDSISFALQGKSGTILQYLLSTLLFAGYALVFALGQHESRGSWTAITLIRYGSFGGMLRRSAAREIRRATLYLVFVFAVAATVYFLLGGRDFSMPSQGLSIWTYQFLVNGLGQLTVYLMLVYAADLAFGTRLAALIAIGLVLVLGPPNTDFGSWIPVQQSAMSLSYGGWGAVLPASVSLVLCGLGIATTMVILIHKRLTVI